jgi:hypothetical protein
MGESLNSEQEAVAAEGERDPPSHGEELVKTPALLMIIQGGVLTFWLMLAISGITAEGFQYFAPCMVGPAILVAGLSMGQLRFYWLALVGSLLCFPAAIFPFWGWFALPVGVFALLRLMQPAVRAAFRAKATH